ncbi:MAG TPA: hypothetical protein VJ739_12155, partial [Gemmataceae bacterium]|nr:hypothetical protein [Gemmataceae bacterium]
MLEIVAFLLAGPWVGKVAERKGHNGTLFTGLFVGSWLAGEIGGLLTGTALTGPHGGFLVPYLLGLLGAGLGAYLIYAVVISLPEPRRRGAGHDLPISPRPAKRPTRRKRPAASETYGFQNDPPSPRRKKVRPYQAS